jgi:Pvc16 N-terminal domain
MAGHRALAAAGRSIVDLLNRRIGERLPAPPRPTAVLAGTTDFDAVNSSPTAVIHYPAISVYCYKVSVDPETRPGMSAVAAADGIPRIPLRMHLMISAWDTVVESELEWLGLAAQILEGESVLTGPLLHPSGDWRPGDSVQVVTDDVALESMSEAFQALTTDYRLSLLYLARVICIEAPPVPTPELVSTVAARTEAHPPDELLTRGRWP